MSYDIYLTDPVTKKPLELEQPHFMSGGTLAPYGTKELWLNITYNYSKIFYKVIDSEKGIRYIYGKTGAETIPVLKKAIRQLKDDTSYDYWEATEGNAKQALCQLLAMAELRPDGVWDGD